MSNVRAASSAGSARGGASGLFARLQRALLTGLRPRRRDVLANEKFTDAFERELVRRAQGLDIRRDTF